MLDPCTVSLAVFGSLSAIIITPNHNVHDQRHYEIGSVSEILMEHQLKRALHCVVWVAVKKNSDSVALYRMGALKRNDRSLDVGILRVFRVSNLVETQLHLRVEW